MRLSRRSLLLATAGGAAILATAALPGCKALSNITNPNFVQATKDVQAISASLSAALPQILAVAGASSKVGSNIKNLVADIGGVAGQMSGTMAANAAQSFASRIEQDIQALVGLLAALPLPSPLAQIVTGLNVLLPVIMVALGAVVPMTAQMRASVAAPRMTVGQARQFFGEPAPVGAR